MDDEKFILEKKKFCDNVEFKSSTLLTELDYLLSVDPLAFSEKYSYNGDNIPQIYKNKVKFLNKCFYSELFNTIFQIFQFKNVYHNDDDTAYFDYTTNRIIFPNITTAINDEFAYNHIFKWYKTDSNITYEKIDNDFPNLLNMLHLPEINSHETFNINFNENVSISSNWSFVNNIYNMFYSNDEKNDCNNLLTTDCLKYSFVELCCFFQLYAKSLIYTLFISDAGYDENDPYKYRDKIHTCKSLLLKNDILIFPIFSELGLYIALCIDPKFGIIIACKGTEKINEWALNFDKDGVATRVIINNFHHIFNCIEFISYLYTEQHKDTYIHNIAFVGHSLGGAIAQQVCALFVNNYKSFNYLPNVKVFLVTYNSAGVTPFIRNKSVEWSENNDLEINNIVFRRRHDTVHQTGCIVFQNDKLDKINKNINFYLLLLDFQKYIKTTISEQLYDTLITNSMYKLRIPNMKSLTSTFTNLTSLGKNFLLDVHTQNFFRCKENIYMFIQYSKKYHNDKSYLNLVKELNKYKIEYIPTAIRNSNVVSNLIFMEEN